MKNRLIVASGVLAACSMVNAQVGPFGVLHFDINGLQGQFFDAPGGAAGGGRIVPTLDPNGGSAAGGASPFSGSIEFSSGPSAGMGLTGGNNSGSLTGPFFPAGNPGDLGSVSGFLDFSAGFVVGGQIEFSNLIPGDSLLASIDPAGGGPLLFSVGSYRLSALIDIANFIDVRRDGFFGDPLGGVNLASFLGAGPAFGLLVIPIMGANGATVDWDVVIAIPAPAGTALFAGVFALALRRRRR